MDQTDLKRLRFSSRREVSTSVSAGALASVIPIVVVAKRMEKSALKIATATLSYAATNIRKK
jgi:hypothetical protein